MFKLIPLLPTHRIFHHRLKATENDKKSVFITQICAACYSATLECDNLKTLFIANGFHTTARINKASVILVFSCASTKYVEELCLKQLTHLSHLKHKKATIIMTGCFTNSFRDLIIDKFNCKVFKLDEKALLCDFLGLLSAADDKHVRSSLCSEQYNSQIKYWILLWKILFTCQNMIVRFLPHPSMVLSRLINATYARSPHSYFVECCHGCINHCSYCAIKMIKGSVKSREIASIITDIELAISLNYNHFIIVADDIASYGFDIHLDFTHLLKAIFSIKKEFSITLHNMNPANCIAHLNEFVDLIPAGKIKCIHYPLQSGSNKILRMMNRRYTRESFLSSVYAIIKKDPNITFKTDIIVGFPGETEDDFNDTLEVLNNFYFDTVSCYRYSEREGSPVMSINDLRHLPERIKRVRQKKVSGLFKKQVLTKLLKINALPFRT